MRVGQDSRRDLLMVNGTILPTLIYTCPEATNAVIDEAARNLMQSDVMSCRRHSEIIIEIAKAKADLTVRERNGSNVLSEDMA